MCSTEREDGGYTEERYNNSVQQCCPFSGVQPLKFKDREVKCCGNSTYRPYFELCCDGNVETKDNKMCCGDKAINRDDGNLQCCLGKLHNVTGPSYSCCGPEIYHILKHGCCENTQGNYSIFERYAENIKCCCEQHYDADIQECDAATCSVLQKGEGLCNGTIYCEENSKCCNGKLHEGVAEWDQSFSCCGQNLMKRNEGKCCGEEVAPNGLACCSGKSFNETTQRCCRTSVMGVAHQHQECCGGDIHDTTTHGCCSFTQYNKTTHQCCRDTIVSVHQHCCNSTGYDPNNQMCCNYRDLIYMIVNKTHSNDTSCCFLGEGQTPDPKTYDHRIDLCCGQQLLHNARLNGYECCSKTQKPLVRCSLDDECTEYSGLDKCNENSWTMETLINTKMNTSADYNICRLCKGQWTTEDSVNALRVGKVNICKRSAIVLSVRKRIKKRRVTLVHFIVESDLFNPRDNKMVKYRMRAFFPCRCNNWRRRDKLILVTDATIGNVMRLGDSDTLLPFTKTIMYEVIWKRLQCTF